MSVFMFMCDCAMLISTENFQHTGTDMDMGMDIDSDKLNGHLTYN
jgi:hypothetical protein